MKRVLTKKPQIEKRVVAERPKRTLKFSHARDEATERAGIVVNQPVYEWKAIPALAPSRPRSAIQTIVAVLLPLLALGVLGAAVYGLAQSAGYDAAFVMSRLN